MLNSFVFFPVRDSWVVRIFEILLSKWKYFFMICVDSGVGSNSSFWWAATSLFWGAVSSLFSTFSSLLLNFWFSGSLFSCFISTLVSVILWSLVLLICFSCSCFCSEKLFEAGSGFIVASFLISILSSLNDQISWDGISFLETSWGVEAVCSEDSVVVAGSFCGWITFSGALNSETSSFTSGVSVSGSNTDSGSETDSETATSGFEISIGSAFATDSKIFSTSKMEFSVDLVCSDSVFSSVVRLSSRSKLKSWSRVGFEICSNFSRFANASWFPQKICFFESLNYN